MDLPSTNPSFRQFTIIWFTEKHPSDFLEVYQLMSVDFSTMIWFKVETWEIHDDTMFALNWLIDVKENPAEQKSDY